MDARVRAAVLILAIFALFPFVRPWDDATGGVAPRSKVLATNVATGTKFAMAMDWAACRSRPRRTGRASP